LRNRLNIDIIALQFSADRAFSLRIVIRAF